MRVANLLAPKPHLLFFSAFIDWVGYFFMQKQKHDKNNTEIFFDALTMKATASFIQERITRDA